MSLAVAQVRKRDGRIVPFDRERIANAIFKAAQAVDHKDGRRVAERITDDVVATLERDFFGQGRIPSVEEIQDLVEAALIENALVMESRGKLAIDIVESYENPDIARKYQVTGVPATIIDGNPATKIEGVPTLAMLLQRLA